MATRQEKLLGYQLVLFVSVANSRLIDTGLVMQKLNPDTLEELKELSNPADPLSLDEKPASIDYVKFVGTKYLNASTQHNSAADEFLQRYQDMDKIAAGLATWNVTSTQVTNDISSVKTIAPTASDALILQVAENDLDESGKLLCTYSPQMVRDVDPNPVQIPMPERRINSFQDLLNAISINLTGRCSDTGAMIYPTVADRLTRVNKRVNTAKIFWQTHVPQTSESLEIKAVLDYVENELKSVSTEKDCTIIGEYIDTHVSKLPLTRRWWNF